MNTTSYVLPVKLYKNEAYSDEVLASQKIDKFLKDDNNKQTNKVNPIYQYYKDHRWFVCLNFGNSPKFHLGSHSFLLNNVATKETIKNLGLLFQFSTELDIQLQLTVDSQENKQIEIKHSKEYATNYFENHVIEMLTEFHKNEVKYNLDISAIYSNVDEKYHNAIEKQLNLLLEIFNDLNNKNHLLNTSALLVE